MTDWIYSSARVQARQAQSLTASDWETMLRLGDEAECLRYLAGQGWGGEESGLSSLERTEGEERTVSAFLQETDGEALAFLREAAYGARLKAALRQAWRPEMDLLPRETKLLSQIREGDFSKLGFYAQAAKEAWEQLRSRGDLLLCDTRIDRAVLEKLIQTGEEQAIPILAQSARRLAQQGMVKVLFRGRRLGGEFLRQALPPCPGFPVEALIQAAEQGQSSLKEALTALGWGEGWKALEEDRYWYFCLEEQKALCRQARYTGEGPGLLLLYYWEKQQEIWRVRLLLLGKKLGWLSARLQERMGLA